ncbi:MAG: glycosyltransferase family 4 protein [Solobacterium sp.]|nr:glycosyltransferase family 4 protein [Solobacterium sp.]
MKERKRAAFITNGAFPVPAVRGGAVEALTEMILKENEIFREMDLTLFSIYDELALKAGVKYPSVHFEFIRPAKKWLNIDRAFHYVAYDILNYSKHLSFKTTFQRINYLYQCAVKLHENDYDAVIFENQMASLWVLKYKDNAAKYAGKYYFHLHNHPEKYAKAEKLAADSEKIICVSRFIGNAFAEKIGIGYSDEKFAVLKNVVDEKLFDPSRVTEEDIRNVKDKLQTGEKRIVLFLGRLMEGKGVRELMQAFRDMNRDDCVLVIVGSLNFGDNARSPYEDELYELVKETGEDRIIFTGYVDHDLVPAYYRAADIVCMPSTCEDAAPLAVIECLRMQMPLITTTMGGIPEYADETCAVMLENDEHLVGSLRDAMNRLLDDEAERKRLSEGAALISKDRTLSSFYHNLLDILEKK